VQSMLNSASEEDFNRLVLVSQIYNLSVNTVMKFVDSRMIFSNENLKKSAMF